MSKVMAQMSKSLDGYIAGPNDGLESPLGENGERLHEWIYKLASWRERHGLSGGTTSPEDEQMDEAFENMGAVIMGRRMFDGGEGPWGDEPPFHLPVFVVTHREREPLVKQGSTTFHFVTDGIDSALTQARAAAGEKHVGVGGGANLIQQFLARGLLDELHIHIVPVLLGGGRRLFEPNGTPMIELNITQVSHSPDVIHLGFEPVR